MLAFTTIIVVKNYIIQSYTFKIGYSGGFHVYFTPKRQSEEHQNTFFAYLKQ